MTQFDHATVTEWQRREDEKHVRAMAVAIGTTLVKTTETRLGHPLAYPMRFHMTSAEMVEIVTRFEFRMDTADDGGVIMRVIPREQPLQIGDKLT